MTTTKTFLPNLIALPGGVLARIELIPMPNPDESGKYPLNPPNIDVQVSLFRDDTLIERRPWDTLIGAGAVKLADGSALTDDDIEQLDSQGWEAMFEVGMIPTVWAGR